MEDVQPQPIIETPSTNTEPQVAPDPLAPSFAPLPSTPVSPTPPKPKMQPSSIIIAVLSTIIVVGIIAFIFVQYQASRKTALIAEPTPTTFPTPTPIQHLSQIATTSAFVSFADHVASLSAQVNGFSLQDGALNPPSLDTEITFKNQ